MATYSAQLPYTATSLRTNAQFGGCATSVHRPSAFVEHERVTLENRDTRAKPYSTSHTKATLCSGMTVGVVELEVGCAGVASTTSLNTSQLKLTPFKSAVAVEPTTRARRNHASASDDTGEYTTMSDRRRPERCGVSLIDKFGSQHPGWYATQSMM